MYAVIRTGGKQYRVAPGDIIRVEKLEQPADEVQFSEVLVVSTAEGQVSRPTGEAQVIGRVLEHGRGDKVLVFHFKRKKQYKKSFGHRQPFTAIQITRIAVDGQTFDAPPESLRQLKASEGAKGPKPAEAGAAPGEAVAPKKARKSAKAAATGAGGKTATTRHAGGSKASGKKSKGRAKPSPKKK